MQPAHYEHLKLHLFIPLSFVLTYSPQPPFLFSVHFFSLFISLFVCGGARTLPRRVKNPPRQQMSGHTKYQGGKGSCTVARWPFLYGQVAIFAVTWALLVVACRCCWSP